MFWVFIALMLSLYLGSFKNIIQKAYRDKPVLGISIVRNGKRHRLDVKIHRTSSKNRK
ncbi:hypothetical protein KY341_02155 [Candidatus Woesearchaeota archaeon]|nr:hypothetical protein [Candidatus Woesearchaeota archaeon]